VVFPWLGPATGAVYHVITRGNNRQTVFPIFRYEIERVLQNLCKPALRDNFQMYSIGFARILVSSGAEIDVVARVLCQQLVGR
jgi:hypothetical protein